MGEDGSGRTARARCSWCGDPVEDGDGYRAGELEGERWAAFCRLEHVVPWAMRGAYWESGVLLEPAGFDASVERCTECRQPLGEVRVVLVRHRGEHRIPDAFCSVDHLTTWARAGGRFG